VIFVEGIDKHLARMDASEQRSLRGWIANRPEILVLATGVTVPPAFGRDGAFYGTFDPHPLQPMTPSEAVHLLERLVPTDLRGTSHWDRRKKALMALSGGSPRTLVALARSCASHPEALASEHLLAVVRSFTAHYQMRFADLSSQEQVVVERLALAPRERSPTELGQALERTASHASQVARRLENAGVLHSRSEGRSTWYRLAEPLFRHWYEYRTAPWDQARASLVGRLLEAVLSPEELVAAWWGNPDSQVRQAAAEAIGRDWERSTAAWQRVLDNLHPRPGPGDLQRRIAQVRRARELSSNPSWAGILARQVHWWQQWELAAEVRPILEDTSLDAVLVAWDFHDDIVAGAWPRDALRRAIPRLVRVANQRSGKHRGQWLIALEAVLGTLQRIEQRGHPWRLSDRERPQLAQIPAFRSAFLLRGKRPGDDPLITPADLLSEGLARPLPDGAELLVASARRRHAVLFEIVLDALGPKGLNPWSIPPAPEPSRPCPSGQDKLAALLVHSLDSPYGPSSPAVVLTWSASFGHISEEVWEELLATITRTRGDVDEQVNRFLPAVETGLVALGTIHPGRLAQLISHLSAPGDLHRAAWRAKALAEQLMQRTKARLHPELERVVAELGLGGESPDGSRGV